MTEPSLIDIVISWVLLAGVVALGTIGFLEALYRGRRRVPMWRAFAELARRDGFSLRESRTATYGVPELRGTFGGRPTAIRVSQGRSAIPVRTVLSVAHRLAVHDDVYVVRGNISHWLLGSPRWKETWVGEGPKEMQIRVTSASSDDVDWLASVLKAGRLQSLAQEVRARGFFLLRLTRDWAELHLSGLAIEAAKIEDQLAWLSRLFATLEEQVSPLLLKSLPHGLGKAEPAIRPRYVDTALMLIVAFCGGGIAAVAAFGDMVATGRLVFAGIAAMVLLIAGSRIGSSMMGAEEKRILEDLSRIPPSPPLNDD